MSGEIRKQGDPLLRAALDSARLDEPPEGAEAKLLAALGAASVATAASGAASAAGVAKATPFAAKLASVLGVLGLGAVAFTQHAATRAGQGTRDSERPLAKHEAAATVGVPSVLALPAPRPDAFGSGPPSTPRVVEHVGTARTVVSPEEERPEAPSPSSLELETKLLGAARKALATGDVATARAYLRQYDREIENGLLQHEADVLRDRAR